MSKEPTIFKIASDIRRKVKGYPKKRKALAEAIINQIKVNMEYVKEKAEIGANNYAERMDVSNYISTYGESKDGMIGMTEMIEMIMAVLDGDYWEGEFKDKDNDNDVSRFSLMDLNE